jgi:hypothetical protein
MDATSPPGSLAYPIGPTDVPGTASKVMAAPSLSSRVPGLSVGLSSPEQTPSVSASISSLS